MLRHRLAGFSELADFDFPAKIGKIEIDEEVCSSPGYGKPSEETEEQLDCFAKLEGVLLDHTYTANGTSDI